MPFGIRPWFMQFGTPLIIVGWRPLSSPSRPRLGAQGTIITGPNNGQSIQSNRRAMLIGISSFTPPRLMGSGLGSPFNSRTAILSKTDRQLPHSWLRQVGIWLNCWTASHGLDPQLFSSFRVFYFRRRALTSFFSRNDDYDLSLIRHGAPANAFCKNDSPDMRISRFCGHSLMVDELNSSSSVLDLGANHGHFALAIADRFHSKVCCVEPDPSLFSAAASNPKLLAINAAVATRSGSFRFYLAQNWGGSF